MYGFKSMLIHLNPKQNILKVLDKNSSSIIFLAKIISSKHICAKVCYKYFGAEARAMVYNYYLIRNQHHRTDTRAKFRSKQSVFKFWDQIGPKKYWGPKFRKTTTTFVISTLEYIQEPSFV